MINSKILSLLGHEFQFNEPHLKYTTKMIDYLGLKMIIPYEEKQEMILSCVYLKKNDQFLKMTLEELNSVVSGHPQAFSALFTAALNVALEEDGKKKDEYDAFLAALLPSQERPTT